MQPHELKHRRRAAGLTQREAADLLGVTLQGYQHWEYGKRAMPYAAAQLFKILTEKRNGKA